MPSCGLDERGELAAKLLIWWSRIGEVDGDVVLDRTRAPSFRGPKLVAHGRAEGRFAVRTMAMTRLISAMRRAAPAKGSPPVTQSLPCSAELITIAIRPAVPMPSRRLRSRRGAWRRAANACRMPRGLSPVRPVPDGAMPPRCKTDGSQHDEGQPVGRSSCPARAVGRGEHRGTDAGQILHARRDSGGRRVPGSSGELSPCRCREALRRVAFR